MTSEIRTNSLKSRAGLSTVTMTDSGPMFSGITTFVDNSGFNIGTGSSIFSPATNTLTFGTNSNERLRITSNGSVVLGGDTPATVVQTQLTLRSNSQVGLSLLCGAIQNSSIYMGGLADGYSSGASGYSDGMIMYDNSNNHMQFDTAGGERLRISSAGVIETKTRSAEVRRMILSGSPSNSAFNIEAHDGETGTSSGNVQGKLGLFYNDGSTLTNTANISFERGSGASDGAMAFITNQTERFRITSGGCFFGNNIGIGTDNRWKIRPNTNLTELAFEYSTNTALADTNIKMALKSDSVDVLSDFAIKSSLAKMSMIDTDGGDYFQLRNDGGTFKIRNSTDSRDDISITNNALTFGGVAKITDNNSIFFGDDNDIEMRHNATSSQNQIIGTNHNFLLQSYGTIYMQCFQSGNSTNGNVLTANYNAGTALYYQNGERLVTTNAGCKISNNLSFNNWLNISKNGTYAPATVGHTASNHEGIFWHSAVQYSIFRSSGSWGAPNYQQLTLNWPTGIHIDGGYNYGLSGARFNCHTLPYANNSFDLGTSALRWRDVYCNQGAFNNSDIELKQDIASLTAAEMKAAKRLSALFKTYRWKDAVEEKGTDKARTHTGMIAQQIQAAMSAEGLDATKYGLFGIDEWYENDNVIEINPIHVDKVVDTTGAGDLYAAGLLFGIAKGKDVSTCGNYASVAAAEIISHYGARPLVKLSNLI